MVGSLVVAHLEEAGLHLLVPTSKGRTFSPILFFKFNYKLQFNVSVFMARVMEYDTKFTNIENYGGYKLMKQRISYLKSIHQHELVKLYQKKLNEKRALHCTCKKKAHDSKCVLFSTKKAHEEKCALFTTQFGKRKWAGQNVGVTEEDLDFLDQRTLLTKRQKQQ